MLGIIALLKWKSLKAQAQYPVNFVIHIFGVSLMGFAEIALIFILTEAFGAIGGWSFAEMGFMLAILRLGYSVNLAVFGPFWGHFWLVKEGGLDRILLRPVHPLLQIMADELFLMSIGEFVPAAVLLGLVWNQVAVAWTVPNILFLLLIILSGAVIEWATLLFFNTFDFFFTNTSELVELFKPFLFQATRYPMHIYGSAFGFLMTFLLPYGFMAYYPTHYFFQRDVELFSQWFVYLPPAVAGIAALLAVGFWSAGLRRYESTGT